MGKKVKILSLLLLTVVTIYIWKAVLGQALIGEGAIYFSEPYLSLLKVNPLAVLWSRHDSQALLFFNLVRDIFRDDMKLYMWFLLISVVIVNASLFLLIKKVTGSVFAALLSCILMATNYVGSFEILGLGYYQWFIQRVPNFALSLLGFYFLIKHLEKNKVKDYIFSFILYSLAIVLSRYSIHILPLYLFYTIFTIFPSKKKLDIKIKSVIFVTIPFIVISYVLFESQDLVTGTKEVNSIAEALKFVPQMFHQLSYLSFPFLQPLFKQNSSINLNTISILTIFFYLLISVYVIRSSKKIKPFVFSVLLSLPFSIFLSILLNPIFINYFDSSRYLYYSSILTSSFWGIALVALAKKNKLFFGITILVVVLWISFNKYTLDKKMFEWQDRHDPVTATFSFFKTNPTLLNSSKNIKVPKEVGEYGVGMLYYFYGSNSKKIFIQDPLEKTYVELKYNPISKKIDVY